jgi:lipopolysaccharide/colanic/teichoic acid biosynthesis glycosyltransferase
MFSLIKVPQFEASPSDDTISAALVMVAALSSHQIPPESKPASAVQFDPSARAWISSAGAFLIRSLDIIGALFALLVAAPMMLMIALAIKLFDPGPVLVAHQRIGQGGRVFGCRKFHSMTVDADERFRRLLESDAEALAEWARYRRLRRDPRLTALGQFLRRSSLDALPQLLNVLSGEMSLVGPRPITPAEAGRYGRYFDVYCSLKPGLTGLWQVKRRHDNSDRCRIANDLAYARNRSPALNVGILALAIPMILRGHGAGPYAA